MRRQNHGLPRRQRPDNRNSHPARLDDHLSRWQGSDNRNSGPAWLDDSLPRRQGSLRWHRLAAGQFHRLPRRQGTHCRHHLRAGQFHPLPRRQGSPRRLRSPARHDRLVAPRQRLPARASAAFSNQQPALLAGLKQTAHSPACAAARLFCTLAQPRQNFGNTKPSGSFVFRLHQAMLSSQVLKASVIVSQVTFSHCSVNGSQ